MEELNANLVVIGSGPAGQKGAIQGAKMGRSVMVVERDPDPGGSCLYSGTIPSKTLREAILDLTGFHSHSFYGKDWTLKEVSVADLNFRLQRVVDEEKALIHRQFQKNGIGFVQGGARFEDPNTVVVLDDDLNIRYRIRGEKFLIAAGSKPRNPRHVPFDSDVILDSTTLLKLTKLPKTMLVLGGGIIGSEYATYFAALGVQVTVIDKKSQMLPLLDHEIGLHLQKAMTEIGLKFYGNKEPVEITRKDNRAFVRFKDDTTLDADILLYALGREANVGFLSIENAGLTINDKGYIPVNALFQTEKPHIYAAGDVIGGPCLASTSMEQARLAVRHACGAVTHHFPTFYPIGIWTIPEISCCGYTEEDLQAMGFHYEIGRAYYYEIARSHISGSKIGLFKILFHAETLEILGVHILGRGANEVIHIGQVAMYNHAKIDFFIDQIFNYPSFAEGYRVAALNGYNKVRAKK
jgi:Pyruvate/2-oxoglutarate dehydrogenase complex, dihydrolipoamide dehydrogenase (E3) component, and related enzymes